MKPITALLVTSSLLLLEGCSSTPAKVDTGAIRASTFSFVEPPPRTEPVFNDTWKPVHAMIQDSITKNLGSKGLARAADKGDVIIAYLIIAGDNASTASVNDYFGAGRDAFAVHEKAQNAYSGSKNPNYFQAGTLVIDVLDSTSYKLLKRGYATRPLLRQPTAEARAERIQEIVDEILRDLRIQPR
jgi:hypothetical protein